MRQAMEMARVQAELHVVHDGDYAVRFIDSTEARDSAPCPVLVILDLNLPTKTGDGSYWSIFAAAANARTRKF